MEEQQGKLLGVRDASVANRLRNLDHLIGAGAGDQTVRQRFENVTPEQRIDMHSRQAQDNMNTRFNNELVASNDRKQGVYRYLAQGSNMPHYRPGELNSTASDLGGALYNRYQVRHEFYFHKVQSAPHHRNDFFQ